MNRTIFCVGAVVGLALAVFAIAQRATNRPDGLTFDGKRTLGAPMSYRNLTLIPVRASGARSRDVYVTLDEGLKTHAVSVKESANGGDVNRLFVTNVGRKPLYLMAGEVVL